MKKLSKEEMKTVIGGFEYGMPEDCKGTCSTHADCPADRICASTGCGPDNVTIMICVKG
jgi:bacteriocin-like protein